jgi:hypothetical protein
MGTSIGIQEPVIHDEEISARGNLLFLGACQIAAIRTNRLQPVNAIVHNRAIRESVEIATAVLNECFKRNRYLYE